MTTDARTPTHHLGDGFSIAGLLLLTLAGYLTARALDLLSGDLTALVGRTWPLALTVAGAAWAARGARPAGIALALIGLVGTGLLNLPPGAGVPAMLVVLGLVVLALGGSGRRFAPAGAEVAAFSEIDRTLDPAVPHGLVAVFGDARGRFTTDAPLDRAPVRALAVFGDVRLEVPRDVAVDLHQTAVFGDVRAPTALLDRTDRRLSVRAVAVFGDVRVERA